MNASRKPPAIGRTSRAAGFTLIEVLVVISILALLIALLLPALNDARRQAVIVRCKANEHQMALATQMYAGENRDQCWAFPGHDGFYNWFGVVTPEPTYSTLKKRWGVAGFPEWLHFGALVKEGHIGTPGSLAGQWALMCPGLSRAQWAAAGYTVDATTVRGWPVGYEGNTRQFWGKLNEGGRSTYWPREADPSAVEGDQDRAQRVRTADAPAIAIAACHMWRSILGHDARGVNILFLDGSVSWMPNFEVGTGTILGVNGLPGNGYGGAPGWGDGQWLTLFKDYGDAYHGR